ncbi:MAG: hypothetical protein M3Z54_00455 [Gemmatimonadota bacterium]|nr:hypothetical protein [Gemmatimonadota bacterium]
MLGVALVLTSLANVAAGIGLGSLWYQFQHDDGMPIAVLLVALSLVVQGGFTIGHLRGWWVRWGIPGFSLFVIGESAAALVGGIAILQGVVYNLHPISGDHEFGPMLAATLMTTQATIGLIHIARSGELGIRKRV